MPTSDRLLPCRLLVEGAGPGAWQMAVDEALLQSAADESRTTLRFYQWSEPTLSLGYFQVYAARSEHADSRDCPLVRRQTGGGAIVHDRELTYSLAMSCAHPLADDAARLYDAVHTALVRALAEFGIRARQLAEAEVRPGALLSFLCFERRAAGDVIFAQSKICGSAQRRRRGAILQHGSLLLARSACAPQLSGVLELCAISLEMGEIASRWGREIGANLELSLDADSLTANELAAATRLESEKYAMPPWNRRR